jgi:NitT/TauT family transport system permease protein
MRKAPTEGRRDVLATILVVIAMLTAMQIASAYVPDYIMPAPLTVLAATKDLLFSDKMHIFVTLARLAGAVAF